jgi:hypothetical protein
MPRRYPTLRTFKSAFISPNPDTISDNDECCICLDRYDDGSHQAVGVTSNRDCTHLFGRLCLEVYLESSNPRKNTCPVCRRKWYTRRSIEPLTPRDTNTSHMLAPFSLLRTSARTGAASRETTLQGRLQAVNNVSMDRHVEQLAHHMQLIEASETTSTHLNREARIRLHQIQGRIRALLERHEGTNEASANTPLHFTSPRSASYRSEGRTARYLPNSFIREVDHDQDPYSLVAGINARSLPERPNHRLHMLQQRSVSSAFTAPILDDSSRPATSTAIISSIPSSLRTVQTPREGSTALSAQNNQPASTAHTIRRHNLRTQSRNTLFSEHPVEVQPPDAMNAHSRTCWTGNLDNSNIPLCEPEVSHNDQRLQTPELRDTLSPLVSSHDALNQDDDRYFNHQSLVLASSRTNHQSQPPPHSLQETATRGGNAIADLGHTHSQTVLPRSMAERPVGLRSRAAQDMSQRTASHTLSISSLRDFIVRDRTRQADIIQNPLHVRRSWLRDTVR